MKTRLLIIMLVVCGFFLSIMPQVSAQEMQLKKEGNKGYIFGGPRVKNERGIDDESPRKKAPDVLGALMKMDDWVRKNLW